MDFATKENSNEGEGTLFLHWTEIEKKNRMTVSDALQ